MDPAANPIFFTAPEPADLAALFPGYEIIDLIATGGMGAVYRAIQKSLDRVVALKILPAEFGADATFCAGFAAEAKAMARLNHPNLIGVYDSGEISGMPYIVMEFVPGKSIYHSAHDTAIDPAEVIRLVTAVCGGLAHAHSHGILHRDIKPSNILLTLEAEPKIGDFGLARPIDVKAQDGEAIYGTPGYTAPEVVHSPETVDHRADVFSVGVLLHELLTGRLPGDDPRQASAISGCDPHFDAIIRRATQPLPLARYASVGDLARELVEIQRKANAAASARARQRRMATTTTQQDEHDPAKRPAPKKSSLPAMIYAAIGLGVLILTIMGVVRKFPVPASVDGEVSMVRRSDSALDLGTPTPSAEPLLPAPSAAPQGPPPAETVLESPPVIPVVPPVVPLVYGLFIKQQPEAWVTALDGSVAGSPGSEQIADAFTMDGLPFAGEFRVFSKDRGGWLGWQSCAGRYSTAGGRPLGAIQFRFSGGTPRGKGLCGRVFLKKHGWLRPVFIENYSVLGATGLDDFLQGIQLRLVDLDGGDLASQLAECDAAFNALLPPESSAVADLPAVLATAEPLLGRWMYSNNGDDEFTASESGDALPVRRPPGLWTRLNPGESPAKYQLSWDSGKWIDTMTLSADGSRMEGRNQVHPGQLVFSRVDGVLQFRTSQEVQLPIVDGPHKWRKSGSTKIVEATIIGKTPDSSIVHLLLRDNRPFSVPTDQLVPEDAAIVRRWEKTANTPPPPRGWNPVLPK